MTLRLKIHLIVAALTLAFVAAVLGLQLRGMKESVREEVLAANRVAAQLLNRTAWLYAAQGVPALQAFLQGLGRVRANDIELLDRSGTALYSSPPSPYKAGRDAPDWFTRLVAPPPSMQAIDFPDGKLVVRGNASRAVLDAWDNLLDLGAVALLLLLAANALVFWLVGAAVRPFGQVLQALNSVQGGRLDVALPALPGREANRMAEAFNRMVADLREHVETEKRAVRAEMQLSDSRELTRWIDQHIEQERRMIARELHDELGQSVTAMKSLALGIAQRAQGRNGDSFKDIEQAARLVADEAGRLYDAMHGIIPRLTPLVLDNFGLADALTDLVARTRQAHPQVQVDLQVQLHHTPLAAEAALTLYRAAQEGITNALRHGPATRLALDLRAEHGSVTLQLTDNGRGPPADASQRRGHFGLAWLTERAQSLQGQLTLLAATPQGACLRLTLPLPEDTATKGPAA